jgi:RNA polymerase sigma factor (sigma-70 family)
MYVEDSPAAVPEHELLNAVDMETALEDWEQLEDTPLPLHHEAAGQPLVITEGIRDMLLQKAQSGEPESLERLCDSYRGLARALASRRVSKLDADELVQICLISIPGSISRFDPSKSSLTSFVGYRMQNAMSDAIRESIPGISRTHFQQLTAIAKSGMPRREQHAALHEWATHPDPKRRFPSVVHFIDDDGILNLQPASLSRNNGNEGQGSQHQGFEPVAPNDTFLEAARNVERQELYKYIGQLPTAEQAIIIGRNDLLEGALAQLATNQALGEHFGVTESRISQQHTQATQQLEALLRGTAMPPTQASRKRTFIESQEIRYGLDGLQQSIITSLFMPYREIGIKHNVSEKTVRSYLLAIKNTLQVHSTGELIIEALRKQLLPLSVVPAGKTADFNDDDIWFVQNCLDMSIDHAAAKHKLSAKKLSTIRHSVFQKTQATTRHQLRLFALRDGHIQLQVQ